MLLFFLAEKKKKNTMLIQRELETVQLSKHYVRFGFVLFSISLVLSSSKVSLFAAIFPQKTRSGYDINWAEPSDNRKHGTRHSENQLKWT